MTFSVNTIEFTIFYCISMASMKANKIWRVSMRFEDGARFSLNVCMIHIGLGWEKVMINGRESCIEYKIAALSIL